MPRGGQPGNTNATKTMYWSEALRKHITQNPNDLARAAQAIFDKAIEGDVPALKEIGDRLEGKAIQRVEGTGADGEFVTKMIVELIKAQD